MNAFLRFCESSARRSLVISRASLVPIRLGGTSAPTVNHQSWVAEAVLSAQFLTLRSLLLALPLVSSPAFAISEEFRAEEYMQDAAAKRRSQLDQLHALVGMRDSQAALWKEVEQRLGDIRNRRAELYLAARLYPPTRQLEELELRVAVGAAAARDQRLILDALRWLYPQLDASQQERINRIYTGTEK